jgi:hypothetical protein
MKELPSRWSALDTKPSYVDPSSSDYGRYVGRTVAGIN